MLRVEPADAQVEGVVALPQQAQIIQGVQIIIMVVVIEQVVMVLQFQLLEVV